MGNLNDKVPDCWQLQYVGVTLKAYTSNVKKGKSKTVWWVIFRNGLNEVPNELVDNSRWGGGWGVLKIKEL